MTLSLILRRPPIDLAGIAAYRKLKVAAAIKRAYYLRVVEQVDVIVARLAEQHCEAQLKSIERLQRELRLVTTGVPITEALTPADKEPIITSRPGFSQGQYDALTQVLKRQYRKLAMLCHPDREGGDSAVFQEVEVAYGMRDINRLNAIYLTLVQGRNLYWQQGDGVYHVSTEYQRYEVELELLKQTAGWRAARLFLSGQVNKAADVVTVYLTDKVASLINEINYVINKGKHHGEDQRSTEVEDGQIEQGLEGLQIEQGRQGQEGEDLQG